MSPEHFSRRFRSVFGMSPRSWHRRHLSLLVVERLLQGTESMSELAAEFGFSDAFSFSRFVKQTAKASPTALRANGPIIA